MFFEYNTFMLFQSLALRVFLIIAVVFICYSFTLAAPFKTLDDEFSVVRNNLIHDPAHFKELFTTGYFQDRSYYRPLANVSYWLEYRVYELNPFGYNLDNLLLHAANALLVFALVSTLGNPVTGFWVALLFALHPVQWEAVANISGRAILLSTFFSLIALISGWIAVQLRGRLGWLIISLISFMLALLSKESGGMVLVLLLGMWWVSGKLKTYWKTILPYVALVIVYTSLRHALDITEIYQTDKIEIWILGILSFAYALIDLLRLFFFPLDLHFDRSSPFLVSFYDIRVIVAIIFWLVFAAIMFLYRESLNKQRQFWFGFALLSIIPVSQAVASIGVQPGRISVAEHFLYFASIGILWWIVEAWQWLMRRVKQSIALLIRLITAVIIIFFMSVTIEQNMYATSEYAMIKRSLSINPANARLQYSMGLLNVIAKRFKEGEMHFHNAVLLDPGNVRYIISLGKSKCDQGKYDEGIAVYDSIAVPGQFSQLLQENRRAALRLKNAQLH